MKNDAKRRIPLSRQRRKKAQAYKSPCFFLWHENPQPRPPSGAAAKSAGVCCGGDKTIKRACGASTGLQPGGRSPYNKMKNDAKRRIPLSRRKNKNLAVRHLCFRLPFLRFVVGYVFLPFSSPILWFYVVFCRKYLQKKW